MVVIKKSTTLYDVAPYSLVETYTRKHGIIHYMAVCFRYTKVSNTTKKEWQRKMVQWISGRSNTPKTLGFTFSPITQDRGCCNLQFAWMHALPYGAQRPVLNISDKFYNFKITCDYYVCWEDERMSNEMELALEWRVLSEQWTINIARYNHGTRETAKRSKS
jgi:hypothetical protein